MVTTTEAPMTDQVREQITRQLIEALQESQVPWRQPWTPDVTSAMPSNVATKLPYRDINPILLRMAAAKHGYQSRWWGIEKHWKIMGGTLRPGAVGTRIFHSLTPGTGTLDSPVVKAETVYNLDDVDGPFDRLRPAGNKKLLTECLQDGRPLWKVTSERGTVNVEAERLIQRLKDAGADIREQHGNKAIYYRPPEDYIIVPLKLQFDFGPGGPEAYYGTIFHEIAHFTESRLGWFADPARSIKDRYALGELRADICSAYVCASFGIPPNERNLGHVKYLKHWLRIMGEDSSVIFRIAKSASQAADYIVGHATLEAPSASHSSPAESKPPLISGQTERPGTKTALTYQMELSFFAKGGIPPTSEVRSRYLDPSRPASPYYGFIGNEAAVRQLMAADFEALGCYNHLCRDAFAFTGPSGAGKTDLARRHAKAISLPFVELAAPAITGANDILEAMKRVCAAQGVPLIEVYRPKLYKVPPITVFVDDADCLSAEVVEVLRGAADADKPLMHTKHGFTVDCYSVHWLIALVDRVNLPPPLRARFTEVRLSKWSKRTGAPAAGR